MFTMMARTQRFLKSTFRSYSRKCMYVLICFAKPKYIMAALVCVTYISVVCAYGSLQLTAHYTEQLGTTGQRFPNDLPYSRENKASDLKIQHNPTRSAKLFQQNQFSLTATVDVECKRENSAININCSNIHEIELGKQLGFGSHRIAFEGKFRGLRVAVKFINKDMLNDCYHRTMLQLKNTTHPNYVSKSHNVTQENYIDHLSRIAKNTCLEPHAKSSYYEIQYSQTLNHSLLSPMIGYCLRNDTYFPGSYDVNKNDIVSVWEYATHEVTGNEFTTWQQRIQQCIKLVDFLSYLEELSVKIADFKKMHFLFSCGEYKFIDFESMISQPTHKIKFAQFNMRRMRDFIIKPLLNTTFPPDVLDRIKPLVEDVKLQQEEDGLTAHQWLYILKNSLI